MTEFLPISDQLDRSVWQVGGGQSNRLFVDELIKYGVALIGPGDAGAWKSTMSDDDFGGSGVRRFVTEPALGDIILLRSGQSTVHAIGLIASDYLYLPQFDDVNGWDLQHARRVRWYRLPAPYAFQTTVFGANPRRFSRIYNDAAISYAHSFVRSPPTDWQVAALSALPDPEPPLSSIPEPIAEIVALAADVGGSYWDNERFGERPCEDEMIAHYAIPLLRAMGWSPENIAVQWRSIDVCVFRDLPRVPENIQFIVEGKRLGDGIEGALGQAKGYATALMVSCDLIVTDGFRYRLYEHDEQQADFLPLAYANLLSLKQPSAKFFARIKRP
jgi:hypothetical protein